MSLPAKWFILHKTHRRSCLRLQSTELSSFYYMQSRTIVKTHKEIPSVQFHITPKPHQTCKLQLSQALLQKRMQNQAQQHVCSEIKCFLQEKHRLRAVWRGLCWLLTYTRILRKTFHASLIRGNRFKQVTLQCQPTNHFPN